MTKSLPIFAAAIMLPACGTVKGAASDVGAVGKTAVQMVRDIPDLPLPAVPAFDPSPFSEATDEVQAYCAAINQRWAFGQAQIETGDTLLAEGQKRMQKGQQYVREGERRIRTSKLTLAEARRELGLRNGRVKPEARDYANLNDPDLVKSIRVKMENAIKRMEYGGEQIGFGASEVEAGQARLTDGLQRLKQGHALLAEDDGRCRDLTRNSAQSGNAVTSSEPEQ